jgi:hypothetical protein
MHISKKTAEFVQYLANHKIASEIFMKLCVMMYVCVHAHVDMPVQQ